MLTFNTMNQSLRPVAAALLLSLAGLAACSKEAAAPAAAITATTPEELVLGQWRLVASTNGMTGTSSPADFAQRSELIFTSAGQLTILLNGKVIKTSPYSLVQRQSIPTNQLKTYLITAPAGTTELTKTIRVDAYTLEISFDGVDAPSDTYQRQQ